MMKDVLEFFEFGLKHLPSTLKAFVDLKNTNVLGNPGLFKGDYQDIAFPILFKYHGGSKLSDLIETDMGTVNLISEKFKQLLEKHKLTGWKIFDAKVLDKKGDVIRGYYGLSVTGKCGPVTYDKCRIIERQRIPNALITKHYKGLYA